ncbi:uncharacterized protein PV06_11700 [Exophiala oligosperma]|uniref:Uncharacterized protein n=1 Tax=Exophiala oligosperma TaxID=215243 RepID=A0A0D2BEW5_9EURO|nr:uncharacterized protein PV06_11700 [Exophiala oligosperma]KIW36002.1 hypothetical protein PV06_11700 [Exophiala oligosperma]
MESPFFRVQWSTDQWCPPTVTFKDPLYDAISELGRVPPTPHPSAPIPIHDAINILVDIRRFKILPALRIDNVINAAQVVAKHFTDQWEANWMLKSRKTEVYTMGSMARLF